jgi:hypothetical protein
MGARIIISGFGRDRCQMPLQAPQAVSALYANLAKTLFASCYAKVVDSTIGDVVQLVRTLPVAR